MKKTDTGYNINVFVDDGEVANDLRIGIDRFFDKLARLENPNKNQQIVEEVNENVERIEKSTSIAESH